MNMASFEEIRRKYRDSKRQEGDADLQSLKLEIESYIRNLRAIGEKDEDLFGARARAKDSVRNKKKEQRAQKASQIQRERETQRKEKQWPKGKILAGFCLVAVILGAYGAWQYYIQLPPTIGDGTNGNPLPTGSAPDFSLKDIDGTQFSLDGYSGDVIAIHFLAVGCGGQIRSINDHQLKQLKSVCNDYCGNKPITMVTVVVATCQDSDLARIRSDYGITWVYGNDYDDGKLDIVDAYAPYEINDGTILLVDRSFDVVEVYTESVAASTLSSKINQLLGA